MKFLSRLLIACGFAVLCIPGSEVRGAVPRAKKGGKKGTETSQASRGALLRFDENKDGDLDSTEKEALRSAFKSGNQDLKGFDTNGDGDLDENEMAAVSLKPAGKDGKKKKKKKNKASA
jgi:hypothetical protein